MVKRLLDLSLAMVACILLSPLILFMCLIIRLTSTGPAIYWSKRVGKKNRIFLMPKFRSMRLDTPTLATHLLKSPISYLTPIGGFIRKTSLDELPQLWSILKGDMSFVGPRPALFNQEDLITKRSELGIDALTPGLTGLAQIQGRDELDIQSKVSLDYQYLLNQSIILDMKILWKTVIKVIQCDGVSH